MIDKDINQQIDELSRILHLPAFRGDYQQQAREAASENLTYEAFLLRLMQREHTKREDNRRKVHIRQAGFVQYKYLNDLRREDLPPDALAKLPQLERLDFIKSGQNIILSGNPGTGKSHLATALKLVMKDTRCTLQPCPGCLPRSVNQDPRECLEPLKAGSKSSIW